jgi:hypothetical protein
MSPTNRNIDRLCAILSNWQTREGLPHMCAFEQLFEDVTPAQSEWLIRFGVAWDRWTC